MTVDIEVSGTHTYQLHNGCVSHNTVSQLVDSASGIHARHNLNYIRTVRLDKKDPVYKLMLKAGCTLENDKQRPDTTAIASFAMKAPTGSVIRTSQSAIDQLNIWLVYQRHWCEHKPSVTISVGNDEWMEVGAWVWRHFDEVSGISFLPRSDHTYEQAPYQDMTVEALDAWVVANPVPEFSWTGLAEFEEDDETTGVQQLACVAGVCDYAA